MKNDSKAPKTILTMPKALVAAELIKVIDSLNKSAASLQAKYQEVGVQALMHLEKHGDVGPINRLIMGMPKGLRRNALASWAMAHGALEVNLDAGTRKTMLLKFTKAKKTDAEAANQDPWFDHLPEKPLEEVFDLQKAIHGLLQRAKGKTIMLHGKQLSVEHAVDSLKTLAALAGEEYVPDVNQTPEVADGAEAQADTTKDAKRVKGGVKAAATQAA